MVTDCFQEAGVPGPRARVRRLPPPPVLQADHRGREGQVLRAALAGAHQVSAVTTQRPGDNLLSLCLSSGSAATSAGACC